MKTTPEHDERIAKMCFATVYPHYLSKLEKKGRTKEEFHRIMEWLTGFTESDVQELIRNNTTFESLFSRAKLNPAAGLITGLICGYLTGLKKSKIC